MAITGDECVGQAFSFHRCFNEGGTDQWRFFNYMTELCDWLAANHPGRSFVFTMDNLNIHSHPLIDNLIHARGHRVVFCARHIGLVMGKLNMFSTHFKLDYRWMPME